MAIKGNYIWSLHHRFHEGQTVCRGRFEFPHGCDTEHYCLSACDALQSSRCVPTFRRIRVDCSSGIYSSRLRMCFHTVWQIIFFCLPSVCIFFTLVTCINILQTSEAAVSANSLNVPHSHNYPRFYVSSCSEKRSLSVSSKHCCHYHLKRESGTCKQ